MKKLLLVLLFVPLVLFGQSDDNIWLMPENLESVIYKFERFGSLSDEGIDKVNRDEELSQRDYYAGSEAFENLIKSINHLEARSKDNKSVIQYLNALANVFKGVEEFALKKIDNSTALDLHIKAIDNINNAIKLNPTIMEYYDLKIRLFLGLFYGYWYDGKLNNEKQVEYHHKNFKRFLKNIDQYEKLASGPNNEINLTYLFANFDRSKNNELLTTLFSENYYIGHLDPKNNKKIGYKKRDIGLARLYAYMFEKKYKKASIFSKFEGTEYDSMDSLVSYSQRLKFFPTLQDAVIQFKAEKYENSLAVINNFLDTKDISNPFENGEELLKRYLNNELNYKESNTMFDFGYGKKKLKISYEHLIELEKKEDFISEEQEIENGNVPDEKIDTYSWGGQYIVASYYKGLIYEKLNNKEKALKAFDLTLKLTDDFFDKSYLYGNLLDFNTTDELKKIITSKINNLSL